MRYILLFFAIVGTSSASLAACPSSTPDVSRFNTIDGDQRVNASWLEKPLVGKQLAFTAGTEHYNTDGTYQFKKGKKTLGEAPSYRFYDNGFRCIDYPSPWFDLYVVNAGKLVFLHGSNRSIGRLQN